MKVLLVSNMYPDRKSMFGVFVKRQVDALENEGLELVKVVRSDRSIVGSVGFFLRTLYSVIFRSYDIVHAHYGFHSALVPSILKLKRLVITFHGSDALSEPYRNILYFHMQKFVIRRADHIIAVSKDVRNKLIAELEAEPGKVSVISCGINSSDFAPKDKNEVRRVLGIPEDARVVLFAGKLTTMKGVDVLYHCAAKMRETLFIFIGNGPLRTNLDNCRFAGSIPNEEMPLWMNAADVFVLPSKSEGTPVVLLEAMSCGTPVISSAVGGCPDLIEEGETGYLFPMGDTEELYRKLELLVTSESLRNEMGAAGRKKIAEKYDNRKISREIMCVYEKIFVSGNS